MNKLALITGASSGIGYELAKVMAQNGHDLILVARSVPHLEEIAAQLRKQYSIQVVVHPFDLAKPNSGEELFYSLKPYHDAIEVLVNNAGFGECKPFIKQDLSTLREMITLNMTSVTELCRLMGEKFVGHRRGAILNVASTAAFQAGPYFAVYFATKAYVLSLTEALREEFKSFNVQVSALCPGPTATSFIGRARLDKNPFFRGNSVMSPAEVALQAYRGLQRDKAIIITGWANALTALLAKLAPRFVTRWVVKGMTKPFLQEK